MKKQLILLFSIFPLGLCLLVTPTQCSFTSENETSVTDDLNDLTYDYEDLQDYDETTLLTMAISDENEVFAYFYVPAGGDDSYYTVSRISFTDSAETDDGGEYINDCSWYDLTLVSRDTDMELSKYIIDDFMLDLEEEYYRLYCDQFVSQYYFDEGTSHEGEIIYAYTEVLFDLNDLEYVVNKTEIITITDKLVAFDLVYLDDQTLFNEASYVAFSTNRDIEDLIKVDCGFNNNFMTGTTSLLSNGDPTLFEAFNGYEDFLYPEDSIIETNSVRKYVENTSYEVDSAYWFDFFDKRSYEWDTIQKTSELANATDEVKKYDWCVHFQNCKFTANTASSTTPIHYYEVTTANSSYDGEFPTDYNNFSYVTNFEIFNLWFLENGEIKKAVVIDTPTDSSGQEPTTDPIEAVDDSWWDQFLEWFLLDPLTHALYIVGAIIALPVLITLLPYLIKLLILIIKLPFKLISGLIKAFHK
jgi:hypothetical protein